MATRDINNKTHMVIIGGGAAGLNAAETLRQSKFTGKITVISNEKILPYDRTLLSKALANADGTKFLLRQKSFLDAAYIDYWLGEHVKSINKEAKSVTLTSGDSISYDKLLLATGSSSRKTTNEGSELPGIFSLRGTSDQLAIKDAASKASNIVVIGAGFIGSEVTSALGKAYKGKVSMVHDCNVPLERILG